ncbi:hypothetical protein V144x_53770 [Gimesia aquarii]|uniref:Uncharacterized protein n=1 Tax=Gimesia aquarii TaxID=2527964 RepID=A0A517W3P3_9PLAN|nr:hypothetical protein V144x_53770 [Gimesia aquarii]
MVVGRGNAPKNFDVVNFGPTIVMRLASSPGLSTQGCSFFSQCLPTLFYRLPLFTSVTNYHLHKSELKKLVIVLTNFFEPLLSSPSIYYYITTQVLLAC